MNVNCIICRDQIHLSSEVYSTECGHIFHHGCLLQWIERSKTCPQCRNKSTARTIHRVYFNIVNDSDGPGEDAGTLQTKLDSATALLQTKENDLINMTSRYKKVKDKNSNLKAELSKSEKTIHSQQSQIFSLKDQIHFFKNRHIEKQNMAAEVTRLKDELKHYQTLQTALEGTHEEIDDVLHGNDPKTLAVLITLLKKTLIQTETKKKQLDDKLKASTNLNWELKHQLAKLVNEKSQLELTKSNSEKDKAVLKEYLCGMVESNWENVASTRVKRILTESPAPFPAKRRLIADDDNGHTHLDRNGTPTLEQKVSKIMESDSPYLPVKIDTFGVNYQSILKSRFTKNAEPVSPSFNSLAAKRKTALGLGGGPHISATDPGGAYYNGLGSHSKEDKFPSPVTKQKSSGLIKTAGNCNLTSVKFRKLAPGAGVRKK